MNKQEHLALVELQLRKIGTWKKNWNSYTCLQPSRKSIKNAAVFIAKMIEQVDISLWVQPNVTADSDGDINFGWWKNTKHLSIYVSKNEIHFIKATSANIDEMLDGEITKDTDLNELIHWLHQDI